EAWPGGTERPFIVMVDPGEKLIISSFILFHAYGTCVATVLCRRDNYYCFCRSVRADVLYWPWLMSGGSWHAAYAWHWRVLGWYCPNAGNHYPEVIATPTIFQW
ncbi:unnamed protein product, partial [Sphacelaria rigidula]